MALPADINSATRLLHTHLNALITSRLPLALPPYSASPDVYLTGLIQFAQVYIAFEKAWEGVCTGQIEPAPPKIDDFWVDVPLEASGDVSSSSQDSMATQLLESSQAGSTAETAVLANLQSLRPHGLSRTSRVHRDIASLAGIPLEDVDGYLVEHASNPAILFARHIENVVPEKPHVLLAYAFVMYMAIFSGGRWIRSVLASPGASFWSATEFTPSPPDSPRVNSAYDGSSVHEKLRTFSSAQQETLENAGLSLWFWPGSSDGMDIKAEFKKRLGVIDGLLTEEMRGEIIAEACEIFIRCEGLVGELDESVGRQGVVVTGFKSRTEKDHIADRNKSHGVVKLATDSDTSWWTKPNWAASLAETSGYTGWALALSCISWYALYHAGTFSYN